MKLSCTTLVLLCVRFASVTSFEPPQLAVVTGGNRGLGLAVVTCLLDQGIPTVLACRDEAQGAKAAAGLGEGATVVKLDLEDDTSVATFHDRVRARCGTGADLLVNNAAVCLAGSDPEVLSRSLMVNFWSPLRLMEQHIGDGCRCIINVSSGDGELALLHTELAAALRACTSTVSVQALAVDLEDPCTALGRLASEDEVAFGDTPMYALSKALLNALTRTTAMLDGAGVVQAVCPGDIVGSAMYSGGVPGTLGGNDNDLAGWGMGESIGHMWASWDVSVDQAAADVCWLALRPFAEGDRPPVPVLARTATKLDPAVPGPPTGGFFRFRQPVAW